MILVQTYRETLDMIMKESKISEAAILDLRGNHDAFNVAERHVLFLLPHAHPIS